MQSEMTTNRMFIVLASLLANESVCFKTASEEDSHLWHCRFGHQSFKGLRTLKYKKMVKGLPMLKTPSKLCEDCLIEKQH